MTTRFQESVFGQSSRRDQPDNIAFDDRFVSALLRFRRAFHLFADRNAKAFANEGEQIAFGGMDGHATHGDVFAAVLAAFGERDIQGFGRSDGILEKHLIEIAHPVEQQRAFVSGLDLKILRHHWRGFCVAHPGPPVLLNLYKTTRGGERGHRPRRGGGELVN